MRDVDLDHPGDDTQLRASLDRLAASAGGATRGLAVPQEIRRRGALRRRRRVAGAALGAGLGVLAVAGVVVQGGPLRAAPAPPAASPSVVSPTQAAPASPPPTGPRMRQGGGAGSDFGHLVAVRDLGSGRVSISVDRKAWLVDEDYDAYVAEHGKPECDGECPLVVDQDGPTPQTYVLDPSVRFRGTGQLLAEDQGTADGKDISAAEFVANARDWLRRTNEPIPVWIFHATADLTSPVVAVQEQYFP